MVDGIYSRQKVRLVERIAELGHRRRNHLRPLGSSDLVQEGSCFELECQNLSGYHESAHKYVAFSL